MGLWDNVKMMGTLGKHQLKRKISTEQTLKVHNELLNFYGALIMLLLVEKVGWWWLTALFIIQAGLAGYSFFKLSWRVVNPD
jgi:hypothetical protein